MKKSGFARYDLDKVYFMNEYNKAVAYGHQNVNIAGVNEQLQGLEREKKSYLEQVESIVNPEREIEHGKFQQYEKWAATEKKYKWAEIVLILALVVRLTIFRVLPIGLRTSLIFTLFDLLLMLLVLLAGPLAFIVAKVVKHGCAMRYKQYIDSIANKVNGLGSSFTRTCLSYYDKIDNLYLLSLDSAHRELILLRRQQERQHHDMIRLEKERQRTEEERLREQRRTAQATEELLAIEKEREKRLRGW